ncbi:MAG: [FeFe] hydrogenase H-cluster radical SAM maturase HydE [Bacteroidales bacterium]|nr:[FeFe] hydrogenase H-cluster radical SAM maturase HydE [Bacteroidales bacterium]MCM1416776.1 [FeFe] hydrogenase H-cluster radical SAM maturase HydE [bacterium]
MIDLFNRLTAGESLTDDEWRLLIEGGYDRQLLFDAADRVRRQHYGTDVYIRGLIEISNWCKNDCLYCGIRRSNERADRYRLSEEEILGCCAEGYALGFRTFVLQGGEDGYHTTERIKNIVSAIKDAHPDCAVTLSLGERQHEDYLAWYQAGADRYLLRHETASRSHYEMLHPQEQSFDARVACLRDLKSIGYQTGAGFMVGSPGQGTDELIADMRFLQALQPQMVGIGPFIPHHDTPFAGNPAGSLMQTLTMVALTRLTLPNALIPATTALGTIDPQGRELGLKAGANVVMPNLSPVAVRGQYSLYDNKICTGEEAAECIECMKRRVEATGYRIVVSRGDYDDTDKETARQR